MLFFLHSGLKIISNHTKIRHIFKIVPFMMLFLLHVLPFSG